MCGYYDDLLFSRGIDSIMSYLRWANGVVQHHEIWNLVKTNNEADLLHAKSVIHMALETLRVCGILLQPIVPNLSTKLLNRLGIPTDKRSFDSAKQSYLNSPDGYPLGQNEGVLLKRFKINK